MYDSIGKWSIDKIQILREYASQYSKVLSRQEFLTYWYIDAFAGKGKHISRDTGEEVDGSPVAILNINPPFDKYIFIDIEPETRKILRQTIPDRADVEILTGDCTEILVSGVFPELKYEKYRRGLCFLDPYTIDLNWTVIEAAGKLSTIELFINFMIVDMNRNVLRPKLNEVKKSQIEKMNRCWGDETWQDLLYKQKGLFGDIADKEPNFQIVKEYRNRLRSKAGFKFVPEPVAMKNSTGATIYYLFFAGNNKAGYRIASHILKKYNDNTE